MKLRAIYKPTGEVVMVDTIEFEHVSNNWDSSVEPGILTTTPQEIVRVCVYRKYTSGTESIPQWIDGKDIDLELVMNND